MQHANAFKQVTTAADIPARFMNSEADWQSLVSFVQRDSINISGIGGKDRTELVQRLQALMARQIWRTQGYYEVMNMTDPTVLKAIQLVKQ